MLPNASWSSCRVGTFDVKGLGCGSTCSGPKEAYSAIGPTGVIP